MKLISRLVIAAASVALLGGCAGSAEPAASNEDGTEVDLTAAGLALGHYELSGTPSAGAYGELVLKSSHRFEATAYAGSFFGPAEDEETVRISGTFAINGAVLTLLTARESAFGAYTVKKTGSKFTFAFHDDNGRDRQFAMSFADAGTTLDPEPPAKDPGTPPSVAGGKRLRCRAGRYGVNFSISRSGGGWMYQFAGEPKTADHVKLTLDPNERGRTDGRLFLVGHSDKARKDYEINVPASAFATGAHNVDVRVDRGDAEGGTFTAGGVSCDAAP